MIFIFDENLSHRISAGLNAMEDGSSAEGNVVLHVAEEYGAGIADEEWLPAVAERGATVITLDLNIRRRQSQWEICQKHGLGVFFFRPPKGNMPKYWDLIAWITKHWGAIRNLASTTSRPFAYEITKRLTKPEQLS